MNSEKILREEIIQLLQGGNAHHSIKDLVDSFPMEFINDKIPGINYTPWQLIEHIRITQWDILEFVLNPDHLSPEWPEGYWPAKSLKADEKMWEETVSGFFKDLNSIIKIAEDKTSDLFTPLPHAKDYSILRELLLVADHNAYHLGQLMMLNKSLSNK
jgi:hypothetical protein